MTLPTPEEVARLDPAQLPSLLVQLAALQSAVAARLIAESNGTSRESRLLDVDQAARRTGMSKDWLYRHAPTLPFTRWLGRTVRFDEGGLTRWLATRGR